jgi:hypothetical protein
MRIWTTKRVWKRIGIGLAILVSLALIVNGFFALRAEWRLRTRLAANRAAGDPASIADLKPTPIPDDENAAAIIDKIRPRLQDFSKSYGRFYDSSLGKIYSDAEDRDEPPTKVQVDAIRAILAQYSDVEQAIAKAAACEKYASTADFSLKHRAFIEHLISRISDPREATRFLAWRNVVLMSDGQHDAAIKNSLTALRLARVHENEPTMVAYLVAIAMRGIASQQLYDALAIGKTSPELHATIDAELAIHEDPQQFPRVLKSEFGVCADGISADIFPDNPIIVNVFGWYVKSLQVGALDAMQEFVQLAGLSWYQAREKLGPYYDNPPQSTGHGVLADLLIPALRASFEAHARSLVISRALRIDNALIAFAEKNGREATGLDELGLPREATIDPYSGEPLKLKHTKSGWIVYSVMSNGVDDGGDFVGMKDYGLAPPGFRQTEKPKSDSNTEADTPRE